MKHIRVFFLIIFSTCFFTNNAQENKKLDSLFQAFKSTSDLEDKSVITKAIFSEAITLDEQLALKYLHKALKINDEAGEIKSKGIALNNLASYYAKYTNQDSVSYYYTKSKALFKSNNINGALFSTLYDWARFENLEGNFKKAVTLSDQSINVALTLKNGELLSDAYQRKATVYLDNGNFNLANTELFKAAQTLDTLATPNPIKRAIVDVGIGRTQMLIDNPDQAVTYMQKGLEVFKLEDHTRWLAITYMELGNVNYDLKKFEESLKNYEHSLEQSYKMDREDFVAANIGNVGAVHMELGNYNKALEFFRESNRLAKKRGSVNNLIIGYNDIGSVYHLKKNYLKAEENYSLAIHLADSVGSADNLMDNYEERAKLYEDMGKFKKSISDYKNFLKLKDSIFSAAKMKQIEELRTKYETGKKEQQIENQEQHIAILVQRAEISKLQKIVLGGGLGLTFLVFGFGFYGLKQKMKRNKVEKEKVDAELEFKKKELTTHALHLAKKNELLEALKLKAEILKKQEVSTNGYQQLIQTINFDIKDDNNWQNFSHHFESVHKNFNSSVKSKYPELTPNELRLLALLKMNLSSREIANILSISPEGIKKARYRLRKKLKITKEDSLEELAINL